MSTVVTPPYRTPLTNGDGTTKDWWLFWRTLTELANAGLQMITYGASGDRPLPDGMPDGAIFVDSDRGGVIYQNQGGEWHYLAGTMYDTLSPDNRPTDLDVLDAGFDYRTTDTDPKFAGREFIWSGTDWVEVTPVRWGTHADRLALDAALLVNGELYVEYDRSNVIYQNQNGTWAFLAGTMWGTLSPDQRPTDLGVLDAGFQFRGTDQQREFIWSGSAWVETTPLSGSTLINPNVVTRVGSTPGTIEEGGITDFSAAASGTVTIANTGAVGFGTTGPLYRVDVAGDVNASGVYRKGAAAGVTTVITLAKLTTSGANGSITIQGGIITGWTNPT